MKRVATFLSTAALVFMAGMPIITAFDAEARGFSRGGGSFSRSSFRSVSIGRGSGVKTPKRTGGLWGNKSAKKSGGKKATSIKTGTRQQTLSKGAAPVRTKKAVALTRHQQKFKKQTASVPGLKVAKGKTVTRTQRTAAYRKTYNNSPIYNRARNVDSTTYYSRRDSYYDRVGWGGTTPVYIYNSAPSYGLWDTTYLYSNLYVNAAIAAQFAHHHQNDAGYREWRRQAELEAKENAELRAKLAAMDAAQAQYAGQPIDPGYLPEGVDADVAMSSGARAAALPDFRICTGGTNGAYFTVTTGVIAPNAEFVNPIPVITAGTGQTLEYLAAGKCDAGWAQANGYWNYIEANQTADLPFSRVFSPFTEDVHVICNAKGPSEISDLGKKHKLWFPKGSGAEVTYLDWVGEDDDYADIQTILNNKTMASEGITNETALLKVTQDVNSCMMFVAAKGATKFMEDAETSARTMKTVLIDLDDGDLNDTTDPAGEDVYTKTQIDSSIYPNLSRQAGVVYGGGDIHTLRVNADFLVADTWKKKNPALYGKVAMKVAGMGDRIKLVLKP